MYGLRETLASVCRFQSIHMMLAIAKELDNKVLMVEAQTALKNSGVDVDVFVLMAPGSEIAGRAGVPL